MPGKKVAVVTSLFFGGSGLKEKKVGPSNLNRNFMKSIAKGTKNINVNIKITTSVLASSIVRVTSFNHTKLAE